MNVSYPNSLPGLLNRILPLYRGAFLRFAGTGPERMLSALKKQREDLYE
jgi:hypothetical protein